MRAVRTFLAYVRVLLYGWVVSLARLLKLLFHHRKHCKPRTHCVPVDHPAFVRPDPLLYSQRHLLAQGLAVTYDNPDITLFRNGVPVGSDNLQAGTKYVVQARIWNDSFDAPVVNMPVHFSFLSFGVGMQSNPIGSVTADVGVKGGASQPSFVSMEWTTPAAPGHYCLEVLLDPADDRDRSNNLGQENTNVAAAQSPATFEFSLRNNTGRPQRYRFETDAYRIPPRGPCPPSLPPLERRLEAHRRGQHPVPAGFNVIIQPAAPSLAVDETITVRVTIDPPPEFTGRQPFNVNAYHQHGFAGGVTLIVEKV